MIVKHTVSSLWTRPFPDLAARVEEAIHKGLGQASSKTNTVFFRADDIGAPGKTFTQMIHLFQKHAVPLNLAVVPTWLTPTRWATLQKSCDTTPHLWNWHQHGWRHINHEPAGKNQEFGPARTRGEKYRDLSRGQAHLQKLLADAFIPVFTPPWNRMDQEGLDIVQERGFKAVSRDKNAVPTTDLPDFQITIDLHITKETEPLAALQAMLNALEKDIAAGHCGVMLHHQRMNRFALEGLDQLLAVVANTPGVQVKGFREMIGKE